MRPIEDMPTMLDRWAESVDDRTKLEDFLDWLPNAGHTPPRFYSGREAALDMYFGINRTQLDIERRELLAAALRNVARQKDPDPDPDKWETPPLITWYIDDPGGKRIAVSGYWPPEMG